MTMSQICFRMSVSNMLTTRCEAFKVVRRLKLDYADKEQLFRMMVFNVLAGNKERCLT